MARKLILENLMKLAQGIGANPSKFMGTKTNITFLGKGPTSNILFQSPVRIKSYLRNRGSEEVVLGEINDAMGFATAGKLNPIQLELLNDNLIKIATLMRPSALPPAPVLPSASITPIAPGIGGLKGRGFASLKDEMADQLRKGGRQLSDVAEADIDKLGYVRGGLEKFPKESHKFFGRPLKDQDLAEIEKLIKEGKLKDARGKEWNFLNLGKQSKGPEYNPKFHHPESSYRNLQANQRTSARAAMIKLLDMTPRGEPGVGPTLRELLSKQQIKWILEGGGGTKGDPLLIFKDIFGVDVAKHLPIDASPQTINAFTRKLMRMKDRGGNWFDEVGFNPEEPVFAEGGLADILQVPRKRFVEGGTDWSTVEANAPTENIVQDTGDGSSYEDRYNQMVRSHGGTPDRPPTNQGDGGNNLRPTMTYTNTGQIDKLGLNTNIKNLVASGRISLEDALEGNIRPDLDFNYTGNNFNIAGQKRGDVKTLQGNAFIGPVNVQGSYQDVDGNINKNIGATTNLRGVNLGVNYDFKGNPVLGASYNKGNLSGNLDHTLGGGTNVGIGYNTDNTNYGISHGPDGTQLKFGIKYNKGGLAKILEV